MAPTVSMECVYPAESAKAALFSPKTKSSLNQELRLIAKEELGETDELRSASLAELRRRARSRPELAKCVREEDSDDFDFLLRFLRAQKYNVDKAEKIAAKYFVLRRDTPRWFKGLDPNEEVIHELTRCGFLSVLPKRDASGRRVIYCNVASLDPTRFTNADVMRAVSATLETLIDDHENQIRGLTYVVNCKGMQFAHAAMWTPSDAMLLLTQCEKTLPVRHRDINLVGLPLTLWAVLEFAKSLLSAKIRRRICIHSDVASVAKKLGPGVLPEDDEDLARMAEVWRRRLVANKSKLLGLDEMDIDENHKIGSSADAKDNGNESEDNVDDVPTKSMTSKLWSYLPGSGKRK